MKIAVIGTGYVGLVTGVSLAEIGHKVTCIDIDENKVSMMKQGISPIYEPGLAEMMKENIKANRLSFSTDHLNDLKNTDVIYIAVGTPQNEDGSANLRFIEQAAEDVAKNINQNGIVVTKSTVPIGTNYKVKNIINKYVNKGIEVDIVSNPEFLREGSAIYDAFNGDRIVIGADNRMAAEVLEEINKPFGVYMLITDITSAEMIKYASNAFLATKVGFINEIANICNRVGANVDEVAKGMGMDQRIGSKFLKAGIGYGGSCFPKDTMALVKIAEENNYAFKLLESVVKVNNKQKRIILDTLYERLGSVQDKKIAVLGLAFKPNTDDMREAPSIVIINELLHKHAIIHAYDPVATDNAKQLFTDQIHYTDHIDEAIADSDAVLILTEWDEIKQIPLEKFSEMNYPLVIDGRNCFSLDEMREQRIEYHSIGRPSV